MTRQNDSTSKSSTEEQLDQAQLIEETGGVRPQNAKHLIHCLNIIGQVEGHNVLPEDTKTTKYEHVLPALVAIEQDREIEGLLILLNTMGGDVEAGLAIAEMIAGMHTPTVSLVVGGGHSIGVPLAVCGKETFIAHTASMTIHPVRMSGTVIAAPETYRYFERIRERIVKFVAAHSHISEDRFRQLMLASGDMANDVGTVLYGEEAVTLGIIDHVGGLSDALDSLYRQMDRRREE